MRARVHGSRMRSVAVAADTLLPRLSPCVRWRRVVYMSLAQIPGRACMSIRHVPAPRLTIPRGVWYMRWQRIELPCAGLSALAVSTAVQRAVRYVESLHPLAMIRRAIAFAER
jgi:hypothetical protein